MNPPENGLASRAATSPALFNQCVLDWFGDWSYQAFYQVGMEFTSSLDLDASHYSPPIAFPVVYRHLSLPPIHRNAIINAQVAVHLSMYKTNRRLARRQARFNCATPRHYLDFIKNYVSLFNENRNDLEEQQRHLNIGLDKLRDTVVQVEELRKSLAIKSAQLETKDIEAEAKINQMLEDRQQAESKKQASMQIQAALEQCSPDICSRVTFVNFTVTRGSLQSQSLNQVLRVERPDTGKKRTDLMKLQGEFKLRLRDLEKSLLQALSESTGNILDDDKVIDTLETLKREAAEVGRKVEETDIVMHEVDEVTAEYLPMAQASSSIFFVLEQLIVLHHFYQFSLRFFLDIFEFVLLHIPNLATIQDPR